MSDAEITASLATAGGLVLVGAILLVLSRVRSGMSPRGEVRRNLPAFFAGAGLIAGGTAWAEVIFRSFGT